MNKYCSKNWFGYITWRSSLVDKGFYGLGCWWGWLDGMWWHDKKLKLLLGDRQKEFQGCMISTNKWGKHIYSFIPLCLMKGKFHHHLPCAFFADAMQHFIKGVELVVLICSFIWNGDACCNFGWKLHTFYHG